MSLVGQVTAAHKLTGSGLLVVVLGEPLFRDWQPTIAGWIDVPLKTHMNIKHEYGT